MLSQHYTAKVQTFDKLTIAIGKRYVSLCKNRRFQRLFNHLTRYFYHLTHETLSDSCPHAAGMHGGKWTKN